MYKKTNRKILISLAILCGGLAVASIATVAAYTGKSRPESKIEKEHLLNELKEALNQLKQLIASPEAKNIEKSMEINILNNANVSKDSSIKEIQSKINQVKYAIDSLNKKIADRNKKEFEKFKQIKNDLQTYINRDLNVAIYNEITKKSKNEILKLNNISQSSKEQEIIDAISKLYDLKKWILAQKLLIDNSINEQKRQLKSLIEIANQILLSNKIVERDLEFKQEISKAEASLSQTNKTASELFRERILLHKFINETPLFEETMFKEKETKINELKKQSETIFEHIGKDPNDSEDYHYNYDYNSQFYRNIITKIDSLNANEKSLTLNKKIEDISNEINNLDKSFSKLVSDTLEKFEYEDDLKDHIDVAKDPKNWINIQKYIWYIRTISQVKKLNLKSLVDFYSNDQFAEFICNTISDFFDYTRAKKDFDFTNSVIANYVLNKVIKIRDFEEFKNLNSYFADEKNDIWAMQVDQITDEMKTKIFDLLIKDLSNILKKDSFESKLLSAILLPTIFKKPYENLSKIIKPIIDMIYNKDEYSIEIIGWEKASQELSLDISNIKEAEKKALEIKAKLTQENLKNKLKEFKLVKENLGNLIKKLSEKGIEVEEDTKFIYENSEEDENSTLYEVINSIIRIKKEIRYLEYKLD
ncbi:coiled-coil domain-containing protein [Metamycoplasma hominis]|uniref:coiled-coil domain-containing protein n=1 Tax=Metamycoplasma hominis TaxID=2098 RepID=UPI003CF1B033